MISFAAFLIGISATVLEIVAFATLWNWFAVPAGLFRMSFAFAFALILMFRMVTFRSTDDKRTPEQHLTAAISKLGICGMSLGMGWMLR